MRSLILATLILTSLAIAGEGRRRTVAASPLLPDVTITFTDVTAGTGSEAALDTGTIAWRKRGTRRDATITTRMFGIRIDRRSGDTRGTATLRASLDIFDPRCTVRIDGVALGPAPRIIELHAAVGSVTMHRLEIEVPNTVPEGAFHSAIHWEVTTE
ncbi:MAG: hypothetical protein QOH21_3596 [Acidobacteriota bacterium]|jgi:hypothetical protein|nr:hypothetical protein [Acidobacteriota bacterium]